MQVSTLFLSLSESSVVSLLALNLYVLSRVTTQYYIQPRIGDYVLDAHEYRFTDIRKEQENGIDTPSWSHPTTVDWLRDYDASWFVDERYHKDVIMGDFDSPNCVSFVGKNDEMEKDFNAWFEAKMKEMYE